MSDTLYPALQVQTPDPAKPAAEWAAVAGQQQQNALLQQQVRGAQIGNQLAGLNLGYRANLLGMAAPGQPGAAPAPQGNALAGVNPGAGGGGGQPMPGQPVGQSGMMSPIGVPLPRMLYATAALSQNPDEAFAKAADIRRQRLSELVQQSTPDTWGQSVGTALQEGWITPQTAANLAQHPEMRQQVLQSFATPEANTSLRGSAIRADVDVAPNGSFVPSQAVIAAKGGQAAATAQASGDYKTTEVQIPDGGKDAQGNPTFRTQRMTETQAADYARANGGAPVPTSAADYANPAVAIGGDAFAGRVTSAESGNNQSAKSGTSTASGGGQFTDPTWLQQVKQQRPDLATGKTDAQLLAMKTDTSPAGVALMNQITTGYGQANASALSQSGVPVNAMTLGLAHQFGAAGVGRVLQAPQNAQISSVVSPAAMQANPQFAGKTVGDVTAAAFRAYGINPVQFGAGGQAAPAAPGIPGAPVQTPAQKAALDVQTAAATATAKVPAETQLAQNQNDVTQMGDYRKGLVTDSGAATQMNNIIDVMRRDLQTWQPGKFADVKMGLMSSLDSMGQSLGFKPDQSVGDWQAFNKNAMELTRQAVRATSARAAAQEFTMIQKSLPGDTTSPQALGQVFDELQGVNDWKMAKANASANYTGNPAQFEKDWNNNVGVGVFMLNRMSQQDATALAQNMNKTPAGQQQWKDWMAQAKLLHEGNILQTASR